MNENEIIIEIRQFLDANMKLIKSPKKRRKKILSLMYLSNKFECNEEYTEKEINVIINRWHTFNDCVMLRRLLYEAGFLARKKN